MQIVWVKIASRRYGGVIYEEQAQKILASNFSLEIKEVDSRYFKKGYLRAPEILLNLLSLGGRKDLWIRDSKTAIVAPFDRTKGQKIAIIHHIDFSQSQGLGRAIDWFMEKSLYYSLRKVNAIITVSEYWKKYFIEKGYQNVYKIYNSFDLAEFNISDAQVADFKKRYQLEGSPIIYLGNCQAAKGVPESYEVLKELNVRLVTSGEPMVKIDAINLNLDRQDYLCLLKASSLSVLMSKIREGWCRTAHESMLLGTPVVGSGLGGMRELLEGGKQIVCPEFSILKENVLYVLNNPDVRNKIGQDGQNFAKSFNMEKFKKDWLEIINKFNK